MSIEIPEVEETIDQNEQALQQALVDGTGPTPGEDLTLAEMDLINSGEASPELLAKLEASLGTNAVAADDDDDAEGDAGTQAEENTSEAGDGAATIVDSEELQSLQALQSETADRTAPAPVFRDWQAESDKLEQGMGAVETKLRELLQQVEEGEKLESEVLSDRLKLERELNGLQTDARLLEREQDAYGAYVQQQAQSWQQECTQFVTVENKAFYLQADGKPNQERMNDLDAVIKATAKSNPSLSDSKILRMAHDKVTRMHGQVAEKPAASEQKPATSAVAPKPGKTLPPALGGLPSAESADANSRWGKLNSARGDDLVDAVAGMSEAQLDAWLKSN